MRNKEGTGECQHNWRAIRVSIWGIGCAAILNSSPSIAASILMVPEAKLPDNVFNCPACNLQRKGVVMRVWQYFSALGCVVVLAVGLVNPPLLSMGTLMCQALRDI